MNRRIFSSSILVLSVVALSSCKKTAQEGDVAVETPPVIGQQVVVQAMPNGEDLAHPVHGKEKLFAYGAMAGTGEQPANGVAKLQVFEDGASIALLNLNIHAAPAGSMYVAWLKNAEGRAVNIGRLETIFNDVRHSVNFEANDDLTGFLTMIVTVETNEKPAAPGEIVAQGTMKTTER